MTRARWVAALAALAAPAVVAAPAVPSLSAWHGEWSGEGTAFGRPATATLTIGPSPDGEATALAYRLNVAGAPPIVYSAEADYRVDAQGRVTGSWTDNHGRIRAIGGHVTGQNWINHWGSADVDIGRSIYRLDAPERMTVSDSVLQDDGGWRVFATLHYRRNKP